MNIIFSGLAKNRSFKRGRGEGSGLGKTCGRGVKGQRARSGGSYTHRFAGGQNNIYTALPKRGFKRFAVKNFNNTKVFNIKILGFFIASGVIKDGDTICHDLLIKLGLIKKYFVNKVKFIGDEKLAYKLNFDGKFVCFSKPCKESLLNNGSKITS